MSLPLTICTLKCLNFLKIQLNPDIKLYSTRTRYIRLFQLSLYMACNELCYKEVKG